MEWSNFLNDLELNSDKYPLPPNGKSLFGKVVHDVLECLSGYRECVRIVRAQKQKIPDDTWSVLIKWDDRIDSWSRKIIASHSKNQELAINSLEWPISLAEIEVVLNQVTELTNEIESLASPDSEKLQFTIRSAIRLAKKLRLIWHDLRTREYKILWTIQQYGDLIK